MQALEPFQDKVRSTYRRRSLAVLAFVNRESVTVGVRAERHKADRRFQHVAQLRTVGAEVRDRSIDVANGKESHIPASGLRMFGLIHAKRRPVGKLELGAGVFGIAASGRRHPKRITIKSDELLPIIGRRTKYIDAHDFRALWCSRTHSHSPLRVMHFTLQSVLSNGVEITARVNTYSVCRLHTRAGRRLGGANPSLDFPAVRLAT